MLLEIIILDHPVCLGENGIEKYLMEKFRSVIITVGKDCKGKIERKRGEN